MHEWDNNPKQAAPVWSYPEGTSPFGCLNLVGNVWEWCADWYDPDFYRNSISKNPSGPWWGSERVVRGGCWRDIETSNLRISFRDSSDPKQQHRVNGFRCVLHAPGP